MPRNRGNLTGVGRRERPVVVVVEKTVAPGPTPIGGADPGDGTATPVALAFEQDEGNGSPQALTTSLTPLLPGGGGAPVVTLGAGTWLISAVVQLDANGASTSGEQVTLNLYRQNNTPTSLIGFTIWLPLTLGITETMGVYPLPARVYATSNDDDEIVAAGEISGALGAGTIDCVYVSITAVKIA